MSNSSYWEARIENIKGVVSLRNLVDYFNVPCQSVGDITQLHCPFHGNDNHASARIYATNTMYCWVCAQSWDVISFIRDYKGIDFAASCALLEEMYGIEKPDKSIAYHEESFGEFLKDKEQVKERDFDKDFDKISRYLISHKNFFSFEDYIRYFYFFDNLYINYKASNHANDLELMNSLSSLFKEISID